MPYSTNYNNRTTVFDSGDAIEGDHIKSIYDELGSAPGEKLWPQKVTVASFAPSSPAVGDFWIDTSTILT